MEIIFIDTSIFEANNFLESKRIQEVYRLSKRGDIKIVMPKLTYDEILSRISKNIEEANKNFMKFRDNSRVLRNAPSLLGKFDAFDILQIKDELKERIDERFTTSNFEVIEYPTLNIEEVFKGYFGGKFPFAPGRKKSEFPDAFALKSVEIWAEENDKKVLAFSKDKDILNYSSNHLNIIKDFETWLSDKIKEVEGEYHQKRLDEIKHFIKNKFERIQKDVISWVEDQLDDYSNYYEYSNHYEVHDIQNTEVNANIENYNITHVSEDYISVELRYYINYKVEIIIDDEEYMYRDYDTREWVFMDTKPLFIDEIRHIDVELGFEFESDVPTIYNVEIESINGGRKLNV